MFQSSLGKKAWIDPSLNILGLCTMKSSIGLFTPPSPNSVSLLSYRVEYIKVLYWVYYITNTLLKAIWYCTIFFLKNGPITATFCLFSLFSLFSHYNFNNTNWKKHRWCAWDSNPGLQNGWHIRDHGAMAATQCTIFFNAISTFNVIVKR